jgi:hypothetical protein
MLSRRGNWTRNLFAIIANFLTMALNQNGIFFLLAGNKKPGSKARSLCGIKISGARTAA